MGSWGGNGVIAGILKVMLKMRCIRLGLHRQAGQLSITWPCMKGKAIREALDEGIDEG